MLVKDIMSVVKDCKNNHAKWSVIDSREDRIELTNDYDTCVKYVIKVDRDEYGEHIEVRDEHMQRFVALLCKGDSFDDYESTDEGLKQAIRCCVRSFNYYY